MHGFQLSSFSLDALRRVELPEPTPRAGEAVVDVRAISLNYRDLLIVRGQYNPKLPLPAIPISDAAGQVVAVGDAVTRVRVGDRVMTHFISGWLDGPYRGEYLGTTLGLPGPGAAAERVALPAEALLPMPAGYDYAQASTLPIAALTAWSALVTEGSLAAGQTVLTLGTGGVSIFALQIAKSLGARVVVTSSSDEKLARARALGADVCINYRASPEWDRDVLAAAPGGADVTVENGGIGTLDRSLRATRAGGVVAMLGAVTGLQGAVNIGAVVMKRIRLAGILVDSRAAFERLSAFLTQHGIEPVIDRRFAFDELPAALQAMERGEHFGKIVLTR